MLVASDTGHRSVLAVICAIHTASSRGPDHTQTTVCGPNEASEDVTSRPTAAHDGTDLSPGPGARVGMARRCPSAATDEDEGWTRPDCPLRPLRDRLGGGRNASGCCWGQRTKADASAGRLAGATSRRSRRLRLMACANRWSRRRREGCRLLQCWRGRFTLERRTSDFVITSEPPAVSLTQSDEPWSQPLLICTALAPNRASPSAILAYRGMCPT